jgi:tetratricopeptide (TPR) repeat protein/uncharacterized membrane protein YgcG
MGLSSGKWGAAAAGRLIRVCHVAAVVFLVLVTALPGWAAQGKDVNRPIADKWALIVGISEFSLPQMNLHYAAKDARDFGHYLVNEGRFESDHVRVLTNSNATRENIMEQLGDQWLPRVVGPDDLVVLYISSHGSPADADVVGVNYIITYDTKPGALYATAIPTQDLIRMIRSRIKSDRIVVILDTCFSGAAADPDPTGAYKQRSLDVDEFAHGTGQLVICSSKPDETSQESSSFHNGVFTHYLIEGLREHGSGTKLAEAFGYCRKKVLDYTSATGHRQTPVMESRWEGSGLALAALPGERLGPVTHAPLEIAVAPPRLPPPAYDSSSDSSESNSSSSSSPPAVSYSGGNGSSGSSGSHASSSYSSGSEASGATLLNPPASSQGSLASAASSSSATTHGTPVATSAGGHSYDSTALLAANTSWAKSQIAGYKAEKSGNFRQAETYYKQAITDAENFGPMDIRLAGSLNSMALVLNQTLRSREAENLERRALEIYRQALGPEHRFVASALTNLGTILETRGDFKSVEKLYKDALAIMQKKLGVDDPHQDNTLRHLGELAAKQGTYSEAEQYIQKALKIDEKAYGPQSKEVAVQLNSLAALNELRHHDDEAEKQYEQALKIMEKTLPGDASDLAVTMSNLGTLYAARGSVDKAEPLLARAVEILREKHTTNYPLALSRLADVYTAQGKFEQAGRLYQEAYRVTLTTYGNEHPVGAVILHSMGIMYYKERRYVDAEDAFERALALKEKLYPAVHQEIAVTCVELANAYRDDRKYDKADPLYQRALTIYKKVLGPNSWDVYYTAKKYWRCLESSHRTSEADQMKAVWTALEPQFAK